MSVRSSPPWTSSRGFTLTEVMVVMILAGVVTLGLIGFYLNSQVMWTAASTQVLVQRDGTALLEMMRENTQAAAKATAVPVPEDPTNSLLIFFDASNTELNRFFWDPADTCVHYGIAGNLDQGKAISSKVEQFTATVDPVLGMVGVTLRLRSAAGQPVNLSTSIALYNRP